MELTTAIICIGALFLGLLILTIEFFKLKKQKKEFIKKLAQKEAELVQLTNHLANIRGVDMGDTKESNNQKDKKHDVD